MRRLGTNALSGDWLADLLTGWWEKVADVASRWFSFRDAFCFVLFHFISFLLLRSYHSCQPRDLKLRGFY